jgi:RNA polymerase-binding transcription factor DksA
MDTRTVETYRQALVDRARALLRRRRETLAAEQDLLEAREPDWEDLAANQTAAARLEGLSEAELIGLARIKASLERIDRGTFGTCVRCGGPIDDERLSTVPEADRCGGCTNSH